MPKRKLDPRTLRAVVSRLRIQARKAGDERAEANRNNDDYEIAFWGGSICALHGFADHLLLEVRALERKPTKPKGGRS